MLLLVVQLLSCVQPFVTPWTAARQASLSFTMSQSLLRFMCIESVMPSNHLILCRPLLLLPSIFPSIRVFSVGSSHQVAKVLELQLQYRGCLHRRHHFWIILWLSWHRSVETSWWDPVSWEAVELMQRLVSLSLRVFYIFPTMREFSLNFLVL